jgi:hypothetical protein
VRLFSGFGFVLAVLLGSAWQSTTHAAVPSDQLFPAQTKGYVSIPNLDTLEAEFNKTQWGQLINDPVMKPFADDLKRQLQQKWTRTHQKLGLKWDDMRGVPSGEVGMGKLLLSPKRAGTVIAADVTGKLPAARELLAKADANLKAKKCTLATQTQGDVKFLVYTYPKRPPVVGPDKKPIELPREIAVLFLHEKQQQLVGCDDLDVALGILKRFDGPRTDSLSEVAAYRESQARCTQEAGSLAPHLRWFIEPFGFIDAQRISNADKKRQGQDMVEILRKEGFTCIQGVGGFVNFNHGEHDILHRTMAYAPAVKRAPTDKSTDKYRRSARMLNFINRGQHLPPAWVPRDLASYVSFNGELKKGFEYSKTLVNAMADDDVFDTVINSLRDDPNGAQVDVRKEIVAHLGERVIIFSDYTLPITPDSERLLMAIEVKDEAPVAEGIRKLMEQDRNHVRAEIKGVVAWEVAEQQAAGPAVDLDLPFAQVEQPKGPRRAGNGQMLSGKALAVANGCILVASSNEILRRVLDPPADAGALANSVDYQLVHDAMQRLGAKDNCCQTFSRTDEEYRPTYELLRSGQMPQSQTLMGKLLNNMLSEPSTEDEQEEEVVKLRDQQIDGRKLPEYERVRRYLGPAGIFVNSLDDGWFATGFFLSKQAPQVAADK